MPRRARDIRRSPGSKNIVLFSDGTGNSSGKLFKTNVWRLYEAVDLGPSASGRRDQIAYYDSGVGTSGFKPLALLGGIFGIGLKRNVLEIYRYACRNYRPADTQKPGADTTYQGDHIFAFGFSRGAFTIRMLVAFIADQGLVPYTSELDLRRKSAAAYRRFKVGRPRYAFSPVRPLRWLKRASGDAFRRLRGIPVYNPDANYKPVIRFVGVWDTVAAYGGPIAELTRAIDNWIVRISMPDHQLHERVQTARHALALDDERDSFQPLLWDELHEQELIRRRRQSSSVPKWITDDRLEQVWFCGMHADVGGGYPDESLSYISLLWMIEEAERAGLRTLKSITERYRALANSFGPMHNSRAGLGAYYRYQPRNLSAWLHPVEDATLSLRDPAIRAHEGPKGLLTHVKIHESVLARIASGTDRYAPFALPPKFTVHPPGQHAENQPQADSQDAQAKQRAPAAHLVDPAVRTRFSDPRRTRWASKAMGAVWDRVWLRRLTYFATLALTLALLLMPFWIGHAPDPPFLADGRTWAGSLIGLLRAIVPDVLGGWIHVYEQSAFYFLLLLILIIVLLLATTRIELALRDRARRIWQQALAAKPQRAKSRLTRTKPTLLERIRSSWWYQRGVQVAKWHVLPNLFGPLILAVAAWATFGVYTQLRLPGLERGTELCQALTGAGDIEAITRDFSTQVTCNPMVGRVARGNAYDVSFYVVDDWYDGEQQTNPEGLPASAMPAGVGYAGIPLKRVINANYLQPVIEIRPKDDHLSLLRNVYLYPLEMRREGETSRLYRGRFVAQRSGELYMFANDAVVPFTGSWAGTYNVSFFYRDSPGSAFSSGGNRGTACVLIARADVGGDKLLEVNTPICLKAAEEARRRDAAKVRRAPTLLQ